MCQVKAWKRSFDRWSSKETDVLIKTWAPLYLRSLALVTEDWRAVAEAVNSYRIDTAGLDSSRRTYLQCKKRMEHLRSKYEKGLTRRLGWPFFSALHAVWADEVGDHGAGAVDGRRAPAGDAGGTAAVAAGAYDGAAADEGGSAAGNAGSGTVAVDGFGPSGDERGTAMVDARATAAADGVVPAGDASGGSALQVPNGAVVIVDARGIAFFHEDCRAAAVAVNSSRTADGGSSERARNQCRGRVKPLSDIYEKKPFVCAAAVDEERGDVGDASGGASVDGRGAAADADPRRATFVPPPIPKRPRSGAAKPAANMAVDDEKPAEATVAELYAQVLAAGSVDAAVVMKLAETYKEMRMKVLDVEREKAAAAHAGAGRRA